MLVYLCCSATLNELSNKLNYRLMANYNQGILGPFSGKVGPVVGSTWKGRQVMKGRPYPKKKVTPSTLQAMIQQRFTVISRFLRPLGGYISMGMKFAAKAAAITPRNYATKRNMENSMNLSGGVWSVVPSTIEISEGNFGNVESLLLAQAANNLNVTWTNNAGPTIGVTTGGRNVVLHDSDKVWAIAYNVEKNEVSLPSSGAGSRDDASAVIPRPSSWVAGDHVHLYVFVMAQEYDTYLNAPETMTADQIARVKEYMEQGYVFSGTMNANITLT